MDQPAQKAHRSALFLYSDATGTGQVNRALDAVLSRLRNAFETLDVVQTSSMEEGKRKAIEACGKYDALIFSGGDGTFHHIINALVGKKNPPTLGYINGGTLCDIGKNFGIYGSWRRAVKIIEQGHTCGFDVGKINDTYFAYVAAVGAFAEIPYVTERKYKKHLGAIAYYALAVKDVFIPERVDCHVVADGKAYDVRTPFILCLNGKYVGGFRVNERKSSMHDGLFELYLTKPGLFNGLLHYLFFKARTTKIKASSFSIKTSYPLPWDLDGEACMTGDIDISCVESGLRVFCAKKYAEAE